MFTGDRVRLIETVEVGAPPILVIPVGTKGTVDWFDAIGNTVLAVGILFDSEPQTVIGVNADKLERMTEHDLYCEDCGQAYGGDGWIDVVLPDDQWALITAKDGAAILCGGCMAKRGAILKREDGAPLFTVARLRFD